MDVNLRCVCLWEKQVYQGESGGFHQAPLQHRKLTYLKPGQKISTAEDIKGYVPQGKSEQWGWSTVCESVLMLSALGLLAGRWLLSWGLGFQSFLAKAEERKWFMPLWPGAWRNYSTPSHLFPFALSITDNRRHRMVVPGRLLKKKLLLSSL